jgi:exopolysaccharide biosynthesis WecB/TagA/CpsF family protein
MAKSNSVPSRSIVRTIAKLPFSLFQILVSSAPRTEPRHFELLGVKIDNVQMTAAVKMIIARAASGKPAQYAFVNADCLNKCCKDSAYARALSRQDAVFADGSGIRMAAAMRNLTVSDNVNGTDMFPLLCAEAAEKGISIYLLGAKSGVADAVVKNMQAQYPSLKFAGTRDGFIKPSEMPGVIEAINASGAGILLVAMGAPRQELWALRHRNELKVPVTIGVGGLFDFFSGNISRAPLWLRKAGFEWIWRFLQEPRRMWRRYFVGNPLFLFRTLREQSRATREGYDNWRNASRTGVFLRTKLWSVRPILRRMWKRSLDICAAGVGLMLLAPFFTFIALAIKVESKGPVFFKQRRVGKDGKRFHMWKFRSMYIDAEARRAALLANSDRNGSHFKMKNDPRITRIGRFIRRASIDELPQLFNVIGGSMSIVGPRPNLESEVSKYRIDEFGRLDSKPGITCIWQVSGRAEIPWEQQVEMDLDYVYAPSLWSDIKLILRTLPAILSGRGAY